MRTKIQMKPLAWGVLGLVTQQAFSQATVPNNGGLAGAYLGWNAIANQVLEVKNQADLPIQFFTNNNQRMQLWHGSFNTINGYPSIFQDGFLGLSSNGNFFDPLLTGAFSRLHLVEALTSGGSGIYAQELGYRPWMRNGVTFTGNSDQGYLGQKFLLDEDSVVVNDRTDMVLQWSNDRASDAGPDRLRFIFTTTPNGDPSGTQSYEGLEVMRMLPVTDSTANVGVGDFFAGNLDDPINITEPTERLDVLNGRVRFRQLPNDAETASAYKVMVVDDSNDPLERGVVKWRNLNSLADDCKWTLQGIPGSNNSVSTAYFGNLGCPQEDQCVGIGVQNPKGKLHVFHDGEPGQPATSLGASTTSFHRSDDNVGIGVHGIAITDLSTSYNGNYVNDPPIGYPTVLDARTFTGVLGTSGAGAYSIGVEGHASIGIEVEQAAKDILGVVGRGFAQENSDRCVGVYGHANGANNGNDWAGWFDGLTFSVGYFSPSDGAFKQNVQDLTSASAVLSELHPKSYEFDLEGYGFMGFSPGTHWGLMAGDVEQTIPHMVKDALRPAKYDLEGNLLEPEVAFKALNYQELSPLLIAGHQEQQDLIDEQRHLIQEQAQALVAMEQRLAEFEEMLMGCCSNPDGRAIDRTNGTVEEENWSAGSVKLRIQPNPFSESTTVYYTLDRAGRTQLMANSADGKQLKVLQEANLAQGSYQYEWNTTDLAPGMYYVTLLLDGEPVVKTSLSRVSGKAVKVTR